MLTKIVSVTDALTYLTVRFGDRAAVKPLLDDNGLTRGFEFFIGNKSLVIVGTEVHLTKIELFADGHAYGEAKRKATVKKVIRTKRDLDAQAAYDANWGTYNGGLIDPMKTER